MTRFLKSRLAKLEQRNRPPVRTLSSVVFFDPISDGILTPLPHPKNMMLVPQWPSDEAWAEAAIEQQERLVNSAA